MHIDFSTSAVAASIYDSDEVTTHLSYELSFMGPMVSSV